MDRFTSIQTITESDGKTHEQVYCFGHLWGPAFFKKGTKDYEEYLAIVKRLAEYEDLEEQRKLLKLPCKVGDTVYVFLPNDSHFTVAQINKIEVKPTIYGKLCYFIEPVSFRGQLYRYFESDFGKIIFLTKEQAESALKEM